MKDFIKCTRRSFIKFAGIACGYAVLGLTVAKEAVAMAMDFVAKRQAAVYAADSNDIKYPIKKSQDNPMIKALYDKETGFLKEGPCGPKAYYLLHTKYTDRSAAVEALKAKGVKLAM